MSTNHPQKLDAALVRPGRIDLQVQFTLATHDQVWDIFTRMYTVQDKDTTTAGNSKVAPQAPVTKKDDEIRKSADAVLKLLQQAVASPKEAFTP